MDVEKEIQDLKQMLNILQRSIVQSGTVLSFAGAKSPNDEWLLCDGSAVSRVGYATLFRVIGEVYGSGDGSTTFNLPDLRGRTVIGAGQSNGLTDRIIGQAIGEENHTLTIDEIPIHNHSGETSSDGAHNHSGGTAVAGLHNHSGGTAVAGSHGHSGATAIANPKLYRTVLCSGTETHYYHQEGWGGCETYIDRTDANFSNSDHTHNFTTANAGEHAHDFATSSAGEHTHDFATSNIEGHIHVINPNGNSQSHNIIQPSLILNFIIKT